MLSNSRELNEGTFGSQREFNFTPGSSDVISPCVLLTVLYVPLVCVVTSLYEWVLHQNLEI